MWKLDLKNINVFAWVSKAFQNWLPWPFKLPLVTPQTGSLALSPMAGLGLLFLGGLCRPLGYWTLLNSVGSHVFESIQHKEGRFLLHVFPQNLKISCNFNFLFVSTWENLKPETTTEQEVTVQIGKGSESKGSESWGPPGDFSPEGEGKSCDMEAKE